MTDDHQSGQRPLSEHERADLVKVLSSPGMPGGAELLRQVVSTKVVGGIPTLLDLAVEPSAAPAPVANGPVPGRWAVEEPNGELVGELLVWVRDGYLDGLEFAWVTEEPPADFPPPDRVRSVNDATPGAGPPPAS